MTKHSRIGFSSRYRWAVCPASVRAQAGLPDTSSPAAIEGTQAHAIVEQLLNGVPLQPDSAVEMRLHAQAFADWLGTFRTAGSVLSCELRVDARDLHDQLFGTLDVVIFAPSRRWLGVFDYKYGRAAVDIGSPTAPNKQLEGYAIALLTQYPQLRRDVDQVTLGIYQPRLPYGDVASTLELPVSWYDDAARRLQIEAVATDDPAAPFVPGAHCGYCKANRTCDAYKQSLGKAADHVAANIAVHDLSITELLAMYHASTLIKGFIDDVDARVRDIAAKGEHPGVRLMQRKGAARWVDETAARDALIATGSWDLLKPVTPSQASARLPPEVLAVLSSQGPGARVLVVDDGTAPAVRSQSALSILRRLAKPSSNTVD